MAKSKVMESTILVWAYKGIKELDYRTGFVEVGEKLATKLLESGKVQSPSIGAMALKPIQYVNPERVKITKGKPKDIVTKDSEDK